MKNVDVGLGAYCRFRSMDCGAGDAYESLRSVVWLAPAKMRVAYPPIPCS